MNGSELIAAERQRQVDAEGWTAAHDDGYVCAELVCAALGYGETAAMQIYNCVDGFEGKPDLGEPGWWPWLSEQWKPSTDPIPNLVKAGALIAAEIDRLQRKRELEEQGRGAAVRSS